MATVDDVAQWMKSELENTNWLYQETVVYKIKELFGDTFVYLNANGNLSIDKKVFPNQRILMTDHAPAFLLWMKLTDSKSFMTLSTGV
ncbi:hypothetical protein WMQ83_000762 [Klebsiella pneumoniae]|nr:hypothetical protein [Klebsiella pneumoniae]